MPPVDPAALQRDRYDRQRMDVVSRAMSKVANIVSCRCLCVSITVVSGLISAPVGVQNSEWKRMSTFVYHLQRNCCIRWSYCVRLRKKSSSAKFDEDSERCEDI